MPKKRLKTPNDDNASLVHPSSQPTSKSELALDSAPPTQLAIEHSHMVEYRPCASLVGSTPLIEFLIPGSMDEYMDLEDMFLYVKMKFTGTRTTTANNVETKHELKLEDKVHVSPINMFLHSLFDKVDVTLQDKIISSTSQFYPYRAYFEKLLGYSDSAKKTYMRGCLWSRDTDFTKQDDKRATLFQPTSSIELFDRLHLDIAQQSRLLISGIQMKLALQAKKPQFYMQSNDATLTVDVSFEKVALFIRHAKLTDFQSLSSRSQLEKKPALYPIARNEVKQHVIPAGSTSFNIDYAVSGQLPRRILLALVSNDAQNGTMASNPYYFHHHNLNYLVANVNGESFPNIPYTPDFSKGECLREYIELYRALGQLNPNPTTEISFDEFKKGYTIFAINLAPDFSDGCDGHLSPIKRGNINIDMRFSTATAQVLSALIFCESDNMIQIDKDRNVTTDY